MGATGGNRRKARAVLAVVVVLAVVAGAGVYGFELLVRGPGPGVLAAGEPVAADVEPGTRFRIVVPGVAIIEGGRGSVTRPGRIVAVPVISGGQDTAGLSVAGRGIDVTVEGTELVRDVAVTFLDVGAAAREDGIGRGVMHRADDGTTDVKLARVVDGGLRVHTREFSINLPVDIDLGRWFADRFDGLADRITGRTDPEPCADDAPDWALLTSTTDLVHTCATTNPDASGVERAQARLQSNRRVWLSVETPPGADYVWVQDMPDPARRVAAGFAGSDADRLVLLPPEAAMTAGFRQPAQSYDYGFSVDSQGAARALSLVSAVLGAVDLDGKDGLATTLVIAGRCFDEVPRSDSMLGDAESVFGLLECVSRQGGGELAQGDNAYQAASQLFGEDAYAREVGAGVARVSGALQILGRFLQVSGYVDLLRNAVNSFLDDTVSALSPDAGAVTVSMSSPPAPAAPVEPAPVDAAPVEPAPAAPVAPVPAVPAPADPGAPAPVTSVPITVQNQVTDGATRMVEDRAPSYLATEPRKFCKERGCAVPGTDMASGASVNATCLVRGETTTNGNDKSSADDSNPGLWTSDLYYRATDSAGRTGLINEVWISAGGRGGMGLPAC